MTLTEEELNETEQNYWVNVGSRYGWALHSFISGDSASFALQDGRTINLPKEAAEALLLERSKGTVDWQPIEAAPLDGTPVLLNCPGMTSWNRIPGMPDMVVGLFDSSSAISSAHSWYSDIGDIEEYESTGAYFVHEQLRPTHWAPLPEPPEDRV